VFIINVNNKYLKNKDKKEKREKRKKEIRKSGEMALVG
jgi:hypothetical protein